MAMEIIISVTLLIVGIAALLTIHMCIVGRAFRRSLGINTHSTNTESALQMEGSGSVPICRGIGMTPQDLKKLSCFEYTKEACDHKRTPCPITECSVCLDIFKVGDECRVLPNCHHVFHTQCVDVWLVKTPFCPVCRACARVVSPLIYSGSGQGSNTPPGNEDADEFL